MNCQQTHPSLVEDDIPPGLRPFIDVLLTEYDERCANALSGACPNHMVKRDQEVKNSESGVAPDQSGT